MQKFAPFDAKFCTSEAWLLDENDDVSIDNSHILVLLHPFDRTIDVTEKNRNKIMHLKCKTIAPRKCKIIIKFSAPEWPRLRMKSLSQKYLFLLCTAGRGQPPWALPSIQYLVLTQVLSIVMLQSARFAWKQLPELGLW